MGEASTTLEMNLLNLIANDYESLWSIRDSWASLYDDVPLPTIDEMTRALRQLQARGWITCYRYVLERVGPDPGPEASLEEKIEHGGRSSCRSMNSEMMRQRIRSN